MNSQYNKSLNYSEINYMYTDSILCSSGNIINGSIGIWEAVACLLKLKPGSLQVPEVYTSLYE